MCEDIKELLAEKNFLGALSCYFEETCSDLRVHDSLEPNMKIIRKKCVSFVKKHFPERIVLL